MSSFDYQILIAAREALRVEIRRDLEYRHEIGNSKFSQAPDKLMKAYGLLAKLDSEIAKVEEQALREWVGAREGSN